MCLQNFSEAKPKMKEIRSMELVFVVPPSLCSVAAFCLIAKEPDVHYRMRKSGVIVVHLALLPVCSLFPSYPEILAFNFTLPPSMLTVYSTSLPPFDFRSFVLFLTNFSKSFRLGAPAPSPVSVRASINF